MTQDNEREPIKLSLGCGVHFRAGWINLDRYIDPAAMEEGIRTKQGLYAQAVWEPGAEFVQADITSLPFPDDFADLAEALHVLEHLAIIQVPLALAEVRRVLKPGAEFRVMVPSFKEIARAWVEMEETETDLGKFDIPRYMDLVTQTFGNQLHGGEFHHMAFTPRMLKFLMERADFRKVRILKLSRGDVAPRIETAAGIVLAGDNLVGIGVK
jgi:ubiquinone/menaquinone biosynthesis C-methylase UbiE